MVWGAIIGAGIGLAGSLIGGASADKKSKAAAKEQGFLTGLQRGEEARLTKIELATKRSAMAAAISASNLMPSGSSATYLNTALHEDLRHIAWMDRSAAQEQKAIRKGGQGAGDAIRYSGITQALSTAVGAAITEWG